jgi:hypothetical protein
LNRKNEKIASKGLSSLGFTADGGVFETPCACISRDFGCTLIPGFLSVPTACGQQAGHYIGGASGLENGTTAPPGFYATFFPLVERVDALKGTSGAPIAKPHITVVANMVTCAITTQKKVLGAEYGLSVIIPVVNTRCRSALQWAVQNKVLLKQVAGRSTH